MLIDNHIVKGRAISAIALILLPSSVVMSAETRRGHPAKHSEDVGDDQNTVRRMLGKIMSEAS